jgi:Fe-S-cluster containining protein
MASVGTRVRRVRDSLRKIRLPVYDEASKLEAKVSCRRGCTHCCHQVVGVSLAEAVVLLEEVDLSWWANNRSEVERRARLWLDGMTSEAWFVTRTPCVFLDGTDCSVYSVRPITCAAYAVVTDPKMCSADYPGATIGYVDMSDVALPASALALRLAKDVAMPQGVMPMSVALVLARRFMAGDRTAVLEQLATWGLPTHSEKAIYDALRGLLYRKSS